MLCLLAIPIVPKTWKLSGLYNYCIKLLVTSLFLVTFIVCYPRDRTNIQSKSKREHDKGKITRVLLVNPSCMFLPKPLLTLSST